MADLRQIAQIVVLSHQLPITWLLALARLGGVVWLEFDPQAGHEQAGRRPALVISPAGYNGKTGLMVCCPMTTKIKGHPFEVLAEVDGVASAVLSDQVKSLGWKMRRAKKKGTVSADDMVHVRAKIEPLMIIQ
ncbi:endoribonuclease MazF [Propionivibrio sp.]|uniref:endoribonuclease MazF n=1 Tax=Propionivibrio sp. TaxID=2212460 RepID=UPI00260A55CA|nr:endoribonuclease MazF [Propionivibrio sp.]